MSSPEQRKVIVEYWFRVLIGLDVSINDILKITLKFAGDMKNFCIILIYLMALQFEDDGIVVSKITHNYRECTTFGTVIAKPGHLYHWKIKVVKMEDNF